MQARHRARVPPLSFEMMNNIPPSSPGVAALMRLRTLIDRTHDGIFLIGIPDGQVVDCNASAVRLMGRAREVIKQSRIDELVGHDAWVRLAEMVDGGQSDPGIPRRVTVPLAHGRSEFVVELTLGYHGFEDGLFGVLVMRDVTERERAERELRAAHHRTRGIIEFLPDATMVLDLQGRVVEWNRAMEDLTGVAKSSIIGRGDFACSMPFHGRRVPLLAHLVLGHQPAPDLVYQALDRAEERTEATAFAPALRGGRGAHVWGRATALRDAEGRVVGAIETVRDETEQRAAADKLQANERDLRATLDSIGDAVITADEEGRVRRMNPAAEALTKWSWADAKGRPLAQILQLRMASSREPIERPEFHVLRAREEKGHIEDFILVTRDGAERRVSTKGAPILDSAGGISGVVVVIRDVTDQRSVERQLAVSQKMESIGRLASGVAHDFNNVLSAIRGYADMLVEDLEIDSSLRADVAEILAATDRASNLTRQLLSFARPDASEPQPVHVHDLVLGLHKMISRLIGEDIELRFDLEAARPCVFADPSHVEQVLLNLVVNGRDAMPGGGVLAIATEDVDRSEEDGVPLSEAGPRLRFSVSDTGEGMDEETKARIFEPFFTTKEPRMGSGIGLSTTFGIVRQLGGEIDVESAKGQGTVFVIDLPSCDCEATSDSVSSRRPSAEPATGTILVVEDEPVLRRLISRILGKRGFHILTASDGVEALETAKAYDGTIDLVVTDVVMPRMGGVELQSRLRDQWPWIRTLFVSGYSTDVIVQQGLEADHRGFLAKPFTAGRLICKVQEVLGMDTTDTEALV